MKSNFERKKFICSYWCISLLSILLTWGLCSIFLNLTPNTITICVGIESIFMLILFAMSYHYINYAYKEIEKVSEMMVKVTDRKANIPTEEYREGTIGILYTNYFKMVKALTESRNRELQEKIFLRDIISDISHQLKTPLASLNVFLDLLYEDKVIDEKKRKQILEEASNQLGRMEWMVLSMLKLARIEAGAIQFDKKKTRLLPLLETAKDSVNYLTEERKQSVTIICEEQTEINCDNAWLTEALINLLKNASDYSEERKAITLEVEDTNVYTRIYVKDQGIGIPKEKLAEVFKRFYRVHNEVNPNSIGIGLSLTKSIVEGMGGSIRVQSEVEKYTWFILTFSK